MLEGRKRPYIVFKAVNNYGDLPRAALGTRFLKSTDKDDTRAGTSSPNYSITPTRDFTDLTGFGQSTRHVFGGTWIRTHDTPAASSKPDCKDLLPALGNRSNHTCEIWQQANYIDRRTWQREGEETRPERTEPRKDKNRRREKTWSEEESLLRQWVLQSGYIVESFLVYNKFRRRSEIKQRDKILTAVIFSQFEHDTEKNPKLYTDYGM
ncbi:hypothetical protein TNCV_163501 [Trichonephila clavipes]|nr:hypothetical protein TNCV_163501 [Trichonephila clavipes]